MNAPDTILIDGATVFSIMIKSAKPSPELPLYTCIGSCFSVESRTLSLFTKNRERKIKKSCEKCATVEKEPGFLPDLFNIEIVYTYGQCRGMFPKRIFNHAGNYAADK